MTRIFRLSCVALAGVLMSASVHATDYTFTATSGDWDDQNNWSPSNGPPASGDKATIPNGKTCTVANANQAAYNIDAQSGGTLGIEGKTLSIGATATTITSAVNGLVYFK